MMNISKVQAHKLPKAATSTRSKSKIINEANFSFPDFLHFPWLFPDHFGIPWLFQVIQVSGHPEYNFSYTLWAVKQMCQFVFDYNFGISWAILTLFVTVETYVNTLQRESKKVAPP